MARFVALFLVFALVSYAFGDSYFNCGPGAPPGQQITFLKGDVDGNGTVNLTDAVVLLDFLANGGEIPPVCNAVADANSDGSVNISDPIFILNYLFDGGPAPDPAEVCCVRVQD